MKLLNYYIVQVKTISEIKPALNGTGSFYSQQYHIGINVNWILTIFHLCRLATGEKKQKYRNRIGNTQ